MHEVIVFYRDLDDLLGVHWGQEHIASQTINWLRNHLSFVLVYCAIMCICKSVQVLILCIILCLAHWTYQWSLLTAGSLTN